MAEVEKLIVELDAKVDGYEKKMAGAQKSNEKFGESSLKMGKSLAGGALAVGTAAVAVTATILGLSKVVGEYAKELKVASDLSGVAVEELQLMAHATSTVGIGIEQLGDISKDTREKIGDFLNTGGGGFQDFADAMKLTKKEAKETADEFATLSGPQILQEMVTRMEAANVSAVQMSHALEGMASDTTKLIPLLKDGGAEMIKLRDAAGAVVIPLSDDDVDLFIRMGQSTDIAAAALKSLGEQTLLDLSSAFIKTANSVAQFLASLNEGTIAQKSSRINDISDEIDTLEEGIKNAETAAGRAWNVLTFNTGQEKFSLEKINELLVEKWRLQSEIDLIEKGIKPKITATDSKPQPDGGGGGGGSNAENASQLEALQKRLEVFEETQGKELALLQFKHEKEQEFINQNVENETEKNEKLLLLQEEYLAALSEMGQTDLERIQETFTNEVELNREKLNQKLIDEEEFQKRVAESIKKHDKGVEAVKKKGTATEDKLQKTALKNSVAALDIFAGKSKTAAKASFHIKKAQNISEAFTNTAKNITEAGVNIPLAVAMGVSGAAQIAAIASTSFGGGGGSAPAPSGGATITNTPPQDSFEQDTSSLQLTDSSATSANTMKIEFVNSTGDDIIDSIAQGLNNAQREGRA